MSETSHTFADRVERSIVAHKLAPFARVADSANITDFALPAGSQRVCVLRVVVRAAESDYRALKTMLAQGDFDRATLVYCDREQPRLSDEIESWHISEIDQLAASLANESATW